MNKLWSVVLEWRNGRYYWVDEAAAPMDFPDAERRSADLRRVMGGGHFIPVPLRCVGDKRPLKA